MLKNHVYNKTMGRLISIGDIHGEYYKLESLLDKLSLQKDDTLVLTSPAERKLLLNLYTFPENVQIAYDNRAPHVIADYLYKLCQDFNLFYHDCPIKGTDDQIKNSRLNLLKYTLKVALICADLLGLKVPDRM